MKLSLNSDVIAALFVKPKKAAILHRKATTANKYDQILVVLGEWGHLRVAEIARAIWPSAKYSVQLAYRAIRKLEIAGHVLARANAVGTQSYVLTRRGAAHVEALGYNARHGLDLCSISGATFIHRSIATRFGIEAVLAGQIVYGEHKISGGLEIFRSEGLRRQFGKLPDLLFGETLGEGLWWGEVESAAKSSAEIARCLRIATLSKTLFHGTQRKLLGVVFICDGRFNHERRIQNVAKVLWANISPEKRLELSRRVQFVRVQLGTRACWENCSAPVALKI
ncbi:hypothetical protein [Massilia sp. TN1-12]|uniref:hypothetical protein n=1 Tax=Massilia paldalensis TaxID=3377675 RepID=UPI00384BFC6B